MLLIDPRIGSGDLPSYLRQIRTMKGKYKKQRLFSADAALIGNGPESFPVRVGVERKRVSDLIQCIHNGRFAGTQLPRMQKMYNRIWLVIEGPYKRGESGEVHVPKGKKRGKVTWGPLPGAGMMYVGLEHWLIGMAEGCDVRWVKTGSAMETARFLAFLHSWWETPWDKHRAHIAFDTSAPGAKIRTEKAPFKARVAKESIGLSTVLGRRASDHFSSARTMFNAGVGEWVKIDGIGGPTAEAVVAEIREGE